MKDNFTAVLLDKTALDTCNCVSNKLDVSRSALIRHALRETCKKFDYIYEDETDFVVMKKADLQKMVATIKIEVAAELRAEIQNTTASLTKDLTSKIWAALQE